MTFVTLDASDATTLVRWLGALLVVAAVVIALIGFGALLRVLAAVVGMMASTPEGSGAGGRHALEAQRGTSVARRGRRG